MSTISTNQLRNMKQCSPHLVVHHPSHMAPSRVERIQWETRSWKWTRGSSQICPSHNGFPRQSYLAPMHHSFSKITFHLQCLLMCQTVWTKMWLADSGNTCSTNDKYMSLLKAIPLRNELSSSNFTKHWITSKQINKFGVGHIKLPADINKNVLPLVTAFYSFSFYITGQKSDPRSKIFENFRVSNVIPALMHKLHKP